MKLCFVTYQFKTGGVERIFCALAKELKNDSVYLLTVTPFYDDMINNIPKNVSIINIHNLSIFKILNSLSKKIPLLSSLWCFIYLLFEIIYIRFSKQFDNTTFINFSDPISSMILSYYGSHEKDVYSWVHYNPKTINNSRFNKIYCYIYKKFHRIICICNEQRNLFQKTIPGIETDRLTVIYNILDYPAIIRLSKEEVDIKEEYIVMVARFDYRSKDFATLIKAYSTLPITLKNKYKLLFVGDGPDLDDVKKSITNHPDKNNIVFVGMQNNPYKWIKNATILVHSSKSEGLPTVLLEALACGTPIISTKCETGPTEILNYGEAGILVDVGNDEQMAAAIINLLESEDLRKKYVANGYTQLKNFSKRSILKKFDTIWKD